MKKRPRWLPKLRRARPCPECGAPVRDTHCHVCGYDLITKTRGQAALHRRPGL